MNGWHAIGSGVAGALTLTAGHETARRGVENTPRMDLSVGVLRHLMPLFKLCQRKSPGTSIRAVLLIAATVSALVATSARQLSAAQANDRGANVELVPHQLLALLHAPQVHRELNFSDDQVQRLETLFSEIDGTWFRSRILPAEKQQEIVQDLEERVDRWLAENASAKQRQRLWQLECQAQGTRSLLRDDVAERLGLTDAQRQRFTELARATVQAQRALQLSQRAGEADEALAAAAGEAAKAEGDALQEVLQPQQQKTLASIIGEPLDVSQLQRIYPMAPEFEPQKHWLNSPSLTLQQLRGKVVIVHFYAFQCHNCHANFPHYRRWHEQYKNEDVVVIGIQTPETDRERDIDAVRLAAQQRDLRFPVLVDLESKNWRAWGNTMWPTVYVIDRDGYLRYWRQGELNWQGATGDKMIEDVVAKLLEEKSSTP